jgi:hypothetical protein
MVFIDAPTDESADEKPMNRTPSSNIDRKITGKSSVDESDESGQPVPAWVFREARALHRAELERQETRHLAELARLEAAYKAAADNLMGKVAAVLLAERRRPWWRRWLGA